ncbi:M57 family metalloprotease [Flavihumibacter sp. ZG627]|uniref:M57 family metalloprotease n=1 Tax=Flavihumibacter sp. ZG627 TaxID=1463156 RepID=UPI00057C6247|nr:M57 family metalloprotease [Flavihumibacter sp. ZG627]KIC89566.1 protease [Flavihumibacter sp. ZG627]
MLKHFRTISSVALLMMVFVSCKKEAVNETQQLEVTDEVVASISKLGFSTHNIMAAEGGYVVEGDIFIPSNELNRSLTGAIVRVGESEQYRTTNLVTGLPRVITVSVDSKLSSKYVNATDQAILRYNGENLQITFQRVASGGNIVIKSAPRSAQYLASAGFPTAQGNPHNSILVNNWYMDRNGWDGGTLVSVLAHEIGHCIGFRHTDYMDRSYSCGGGPSNEGASTVGAIHIPGTPTDQDPKSWMLACIGKGVDRPFNNNDIIALSYLY